MLLYVDAVLQKRPSASVASRHTPSRPKFRLKVFFIGSSGHMQNKRRNSLLACLPIQEYTHYALFKIKIMYSTIFTGVL